MCFEDNIFSFNEPSLSACNVIDLLVFAGVSCLRVRLSPLFCYAVAVALSNRDFPPEGVGSEGWKAAVSE